MLKIHSSVSPLRIFSSAFFYSITDAQAKPTLNAAMDVESDSDGPCKKRQKTRVQPRHDRKL